jgi:oligopeptidase A
MYSVFKEHGVLNGEVGRRYRDIVLAPGGERDSMESLVAFLGRAPTQDAFLRHIGLPASSSPAGQA